MRRSTHVESNVWRYAWRWTQMSPQITVSKAASAIGRQFALEITARDIRLLAPALLASQGFLEADDLAAKLVALLTSLAEHCSKQLHYNFGLEKLKHICRQAGVEGRQKGYDVESSVLASAVCCALFVSLAPDDLPVAHKLLKEHLGTDVPPMLLASNRWATVAARAAAMHQICTAVLPVSSIEIESFVSAIEIQASKDGARVVQMPSLVGELSYVHCLGTMDDDGIWTDGTLTKVLRDACVERQMTWVIIAVTKSLPAFWTHFKSLVSDERLLRLPTGERIFLTENLRVFLSVSDAADIPSVAIPCLGVVYASEM